MGTSSKIDGLPSKVALPEEVRDLNQFLLSQGYRVACDPRVAVELVESLVDVVDLSLMRSWSPGDTAFVLTHCLEFLRHVDRGGVVIKPVAPVPLPAKVEEPSGSGKPVITKRSRSQRPNAATLPGPMEGLHLGLSAVQQAAMAVSNPGATHRPKNGVAAKRDILDGVFGNDVNPGLPAIPLDPVLPAVVEDDELEPNPAPAPEPAPLPQPERPYIPSLEETRGTTIRGFAAATTLAGLMGWGIYNELEHPAVGSLPDQNPYHVIATPEEVAPAPVAAPVAPAETTPVYTAVVAAFEGDPEADLKIPATTNALVHDYYVGDGIGHGWQDVKALHAWSDSPEALQRLEWHMGRWGKNMGGYEAVILSGESCGATTIDELLNCVVSDPAIPDGEKVAKRVAEMVTAMKDAKIMPDQGAVLEMHEKMKDDLPAMVKEINREVEAGMLKAPATFHYPVAAEQSGEMGALYDAPDPMNLLHQEETVEMADVSEFLEEEDVPDVTDSLEDMDATDVVEPLHLQAASTAVEQAPAHTGLSGLATWMENAQTHLNKKARGKNRELLPAFCAGVAADVREMGIRFEGFSPSGREVALFQLKTKFLTRLNVLHGRPKAKYLAEFTRGFTESLAAMLPDQERGKDLMALPEGIFRA